MHEQRRGVELEIDGPLLPICCRRELSNLSLVANHCELNQEQIANGQVGNCQAVHVGLLCIRRGGVKNSGEALSGEAGLGEL